MSYEGLGQCLLIGRFSFLRKGTRECVPTKGGSCNSASLGKGVGEEAPTDCSGGVVWFSPRLWSSRPDLYPCRVTEAFIGV